MRPDPCEEKYNSVISDYINQNYGRSIQGWVMTRGHRFLETLCNDSEFFKKVIEIGAGEFGHSSFLKHNYDQYIMTDKSVRAVQIAEGKYANQQAIMVQVQSANALTYPDNYFDRLIACHVLEHLSEPHKVLREWNRVVKPGGIISILLPCDPGILWSAGRGLSGYKKYLKNGVDMYYWMAREHINPIGNLVKFIQYYFENVKEIWWPSRIPSSNLNLFYACQIRV